jgi:hypothetical protein
MIPRVSDSQLSPSPSPCLVQVPSPPTIRSRPGAGRKPAPGRTRRGSESAGRNLYSRVCFQNRDSSSHCQPTLRIAAARARRAVRRADWGWHRQLPGAGMISRNWPPGLTQPAQIISSCHRFRPADIMQFSRCSCPARPRSDLIDQKNSKSGWANAVSTVQCCCSCSYFASLTWHINIR